MHLLYPSEILKTKKLLGYPKVCYSFKTKDNMNSSTDDKKYDSNVHNAHRYLLFNTLQLQGKWDTLFIAKTVIRRFQIRFITIFVDAVFAILNVSN